MENWESNSWWVCKIFFSLHHRPHIDFILFFQFTYFTYIHCWRCNFYWGKDFMIMWRASKFLKQHNIIKYIYLDAYVTNMCVYFFIYYKTAWKSNISGVKINSRYKQLQINIKKYINTNEVNPMIDLTDMNIVDILNFFRKICLFEL